MKKRVFSDWTIKARSEETGKVFEDKFPASSKGEAIAAFKECYRHRVYTVLEAIEGEPYKD